MDPGLAVLKIFMIFRVYCSSFFLYFLDFLKIFHNTVMIYHTRNRSNDTAESQKEKKTCFKVHFQHGQLKITGLNKMWPLKSLAMGYMQYNYMQ